MATWAAFCLLALTQCKGEFTGPYPCETPYASCVDPERNQCETDTGSEAMHCGACDRSCDLGALCQNAQCGASAQKLTDLPGASSGQMAVNSRGIYWSPNGAGQIFQIPSNGGTPSIVVPNLSSCASSPPFALDDSALYYWTSNFPCTDVACTSLGIVRTALDSGTTSMLVADSPNTTNGCPFSVVIAGNSLFWLTQKNASVQVFSAPLTGGTTTALALIPTNGSPGPLWITRSRALFVVWESNGPMLQEIPLDGSPGTSISLPANNKLPATDLFVADDTYAYVATGGCSCSNGPSTNAPPGGIDRVALDGSGRVTLAEFTGVVSSMVRDATHVYWATDTTVWKVPLAGGPFTRIAGNLTKGPSTPCSGGCGTQPTKYLTIAVDATSVYIADGSPSVNVLLKAKK